MKLFVYILLIIGVVGCDTKTFEEYYNEALVLADNGQYDEANFKLDKAIEKNPKSIDALLERGVNKSSLNDYEGAIADYNTILELDDKNILVTVNRGKCLSRLENYPEAIAAFNKALELKGINYRDINQTQLYIIDHHNVYDSKLTEILFERGRNYFYSDSLKKAYTDFNYCISHKFKLASSYYYRGRINNSLKRYKQACEDIYKSKELGDSDALDIYNKYCK